ncbi:DUF2254 domain-containing protein [Nitratireductor sp. CAU 1489]|uniref:DUF2254 domain-containing protein n=1 Tax=Nitratireductor arenosus TaxID=2682096 RepID=A0A844QC24_9HYPH|nr:DUF2254 domain-containing protein [Nitratireductor arenosus]
MSRWGWLLLQVTRRLWFRATLISLLAVAAALLSLVVSPYLPQGLSARIGADAVENILNIIASSMLAVTTFSLSTMVAAYSAATGNVTPRATRLLIEDTTTQNVLGTFVGSFLFSLVAIITLAMGAYGERGRVVLFVVTIFVVLLIVVTLLRWIDYLLRLGRVSETTQQVETATARAIRGRVDRPCLGGKPISPAASRLLSGGQTVSSDRIGYVQHVDMRALSNLADKTATEIVVDAVPGAFVDPARPLAHCDADRQDLDLIRSAFTIADERSYDQDPRYGLAVLAEIASRALSPAVNDPGTAIDVLGRAVRVLAVWAEERESAEPAFPRVLVPEIEIADLFDDIFVPIERDGAGLAEVQIRLHKALAALGRAGDGRFRDEAVRRSRLALQRAETGLAFRPDFDRVQAAAQLVGVDLPGRDDARRQPSGA